MLARLKETSLALLLLAASAPACGQITRDSGRGVPPGSAGRGSLPGGAGGLVVAGAAGAGMAGGAGGVAGTPRITAGGEAGAAGVAACPDPDAPRSASFQFQLDPLPETGSSEPDISEGEWGCVIRAPEFENATMVLYLDCDAQMDSFDPIRFTLAITASPNPSWTEFAAGTSVIYSWRATTHGWGYYWWARLARPDGVPLLIAYLTGSEFESERLLPFTADVVSGLCPFVEESCFRVEHQALQINDSDSGPIHLFEYFTARLGDYRVWVSRFEAHPEIYCTDQWPFDYGVGIILDPEG
jgi:hypothetical protein